MNKWDLFFIEMSETCAKQSTCLRRKVGAVIVKDNHVLSMGYNGSPAKTNHCKDLGCMRIQLNVPSGERHELCRAVHAEANAIIFAAKHGVEIDGATLYCTTYPCSQCAKLIINSGIKEVYYTKDYPDELSHRLFEEAGVKLYNLA